MRNAVVLVTDATIFPAAMFAAHRLAALNNRDDTDIIVFTNAGREAQAALAMGLPFEVAPMVYPDGVWLPPTYFRLFLPNLLVKQYRRIIYVDVDTYAESAKLFALFDLDMRGRMIAAVRDAVVAFSPDREELGTVFGGRHARYLNAGVLVIDSEAYVARQAILALVDIISRNYAKRRWYKDQSALNMLLDGNWLELSPAFNMFVAAHNSWLPRTCEPTVTHFAGPGKPWHGPRFRSDHPARAEMERFFPASPWKDFLPRFFNVGDIMDPNTRDGPAEMDRIFSGEAAFVSYLRDTEFADVTAGLTERHLEQLPSG